MTIYIVLGVLYESFIHPLTILSTLPSAGVGALLALMLVGQDLSVIALIGIVLLMGIVKKNAIMMIDFALEAERRQGMSPRDAILQASLLRFRPIMMTTLAALFGALPLALESGTGSELRFPLGVTIIGGLLLSQLLTLYTTPVIYLAMERLRLRLTRRPAPPASQRSGVTMNISYPFIMRPVGTTLLAIGLMLIGIVAYRFLPVASMPNVELPTIRVSASRPGADPAIMAATVAAPLERNLGTISGVTEITSVSSLGSTNITVQFDLNRKIDGAARDVQAAINASLTDLPSDLPSTAVVPQVQPGRAAGADPGADLEDRAAERDLRRGRHRGGAAHRAGAGRRRRDGERRRAAGGARARQSRRDRVGRHLARAGAHRDRRRERAEPARRARRRRAAETIGTNDQLRRAPDYRTLVVKSANGNVVRLSDIASVEQSTRNSRSAAWFNREPSVLIIITKQGDANVIETVDNIRALIPEIKRWIPADIDISVLSDRTGTIRASVADMQLTLVGTIAMVMLVVFLFLRRATPTIAAGVTVPLSLAGTCALMWCVGFSIDNLSLMALAVSVGFVVDDAIVMIENVFRNMEKGHSPLRATIEGARQIGFTVISISISLVAAFIPLLFMGGIVGRAFREFSVTLAFAILVSTIVSLTVTPMICAHYVRSVPSRTETALRPRGRMGAVAHDPRLRGEPAACCSSIAC